MRTRRKYAKRGVVPGKIGTKRSDRRFRAPDGSEWDSRFEWQVYDALRKQGADVARVRKGSGHTFPYSHAVRDASCLACGSDSVGKRRSYTPDLLVDGAGADSVAAAPAGAYYVELKGYLRSEERGLLRALCKARTDLDLRFIFQRDWFVSKKSGLKVTDWVKKFLKKPAAVWSGKLPNWEDCK